MTKITKDTEFEIEKIQHLDFELTIEPDGFEISTKAEGDQERTMTAVITSSSVDRVGDRILPGAFFNIGKDGKSIPLLWAHDRGAAPVGKSMWIKPTPGGKKVIGKFIFANTTKAIEAWDLVQGGFLSKVSVGFNVMSRDDIVENKTGGFDISKAELLEVSIVNIPANRDAIIQGIKSLMEDGKSFSESTLKEFEITIEEDEPESKEATFEELLKEIDNKYKSLRSLMDDYMIVLKQFTNTQDQSVTEESGDDAAISFDLESEVEKSDPTTATSDGDEQELIIIDDGV